MDYQYYHIAAANTYVISTRDIGVLHSIVVNTTAAGSITISDDNGTIGILKASVVEGTYFYDVAYTGGLTVITAGASDITVCYS